MAERITGPTGDSFLRQLTSARWEDDGDRAANVLAWIPQDAMSNDETVATRAGQTAHAIALFIAENRKEVASAPANRILWRAYADAIAPYVGAMVGDTSGVAGFEPLDDPASQMRRSASLFAAMTRDFDANQIFTRAASERAHEYEISFAKAAVTEPLLADRGPAQEHLLRAARLRSLVATGAHLANPDSDGPTPTPARAQTELAYQVVSLTVRPDDPHINEEFFSGGRLMAPAEISDDEWSIYDSQLTVYLASSPRINEAIRQFGRAFDVIASAS
ncbi:hypothetical protein [Mycolicibacterium houstonense]|uniref:hypothetical protein n=1 Tax=Mycolicibacterium houstonense TaxID=146021 RepID=UPI003F97F739